MFNKKIPRRITLRRRTIRSLKQPAGKAQKAKFFIALRIQEMQK